MSLWNVESYVRLRTGGVDEAFEAFAEAHVRPGWAVLEVACGPGRAAAALAERYAAAVTAVDVSAEMLAAARGIVPATVTLVEAAAEDLPFADGSFDVALCQMAVHLLDRPRAFAELRRVLQPEGVLWLKTSDPDRVEQHWLAPFFPSFAAIERARFPDAATLERELGDAGFAAEIERVTLPRELRRETALGQLGSGAYSTLALLPPEEVEAALAVAERTLGDPVVYDATLLTARARPA